MKSGISVDVPTISASLFARIRAAYLENISDFGGSGDSMWTGISTLRQPVHLALISEDPAKALQALQNPTSNKLYYGVDEIYDRPLPGEPELEGTAEFIEHLLRTAAYGTGVLRKPNPEGGVLYSKGGAPPPPPLEDILTIFDEQHVRIDFPNPFAGEFGLATSRGMASNRAANAIYQAAQIKLLRGRADLAVAEIGAGIGRTAYYSARFGIKPYTIVDLPLALVGQATFLGLTLGSDAIWFGNENGTGEGKVRLLSPNQFHSSSDRFGVVLNCDSLPEMSATHMSEYIARLQKDQALFLSINHEANERTVHEMVPYSALVSRNDYPLRPGYAEERYDFRR